jgi:hypothetical protein
MQMCRRMSFQYGSALTLTNPQAKLPPEKIGFDNAARYLCACRLQVSGYLLLPASDGTQVQEI